MYIYFIIKYKKKNIIKKNKKYVLQRLNFLNTQEDK